MKLNISTHFRQAALAASLLTASEAYAEETPENPASYPYTSQLPESATNEILQSIQKETQTETSVVIVTDEPHSPQTILKQPEKKDNLTILPHGIAITLVMIVIILTLILISKNAKLQELENFKIEKEILNKELERLKEKLKTEEKKLDKMRALSERYEDDATRSREKAHKLQIKQTSLESDIRVQKQKNDAQLREIQHLEKKQQDLHDHIALHEDTIARLQQEQDAAESKINNLRNALASEKTINEATLKDAVNSTTLVEAASTAQSIRELADGFLNRLRDLTESVSAGNHFLIFSIEDDLEALAKQVQQDTAYLYDTCCGDNIPDEDKQENEQMLAPIIEGSEQLKNLLAERRYPEAFRFGNQLMGKIALLTDSLGQTTEYEENNPMQNWTEYMNKRSIPVDWVDDNCCLYNFFEEFNLEPIAAWSPDFEHQAKAAFRERVVTAHPDHGGKEEQFAKVKLIGEIFRDEIKTTKYIHAFNEYNSIFSNTQSYGQAA